MNAGGKIEWQRDFFDFGHIAKMFGKLIESGDLSAPACRSGSSAASPAKSCPGYYPLGQAPVPIW